MSPASLGQLQGGKNPRAARPHPRVYPCFWPSRGTAGIPRPHTQCTQKGQEDTCLRAPGRLRAWHAWSPLTSSASSQEVERHGPAPRAA